MTNLMENETLTGMFQDLSIDKAHTSPSLEQLSLVNNKYLRDMKLNVATMLNSKNLSRKETTLIALAVAVNEKHEALIAAFTRMATNEGATAEELAEVHACTSIMNVNNVLYRFRHYMGANEYYDKTPAGLRMSVMMNPVLGKMLFELISVVVSIINGCERCVVAHEQSVKALGATEPMIYDAIRLGAAIKGLTAVV
jgi:lipoyl-dependent peroxiredoxin subunit D